MWRRFDIDSLDNRDSELIHRICDRVDRAMDVWHRPEISGVAAIPDGPGLYVANHNGGWWTPDTWIFCSAVLRERGLHDVPYGLGHEFAISVRPMHEYLVRLGAVRASHSNGQRLFERGNKVLVYPGGDEDALRPWRHRNRIVFGGRTGYIRLALTSGVPIIPVVAQGAHSSLIVIDDMKWLARLIRADKVLRVKVWPLTLSVPFGLTLGPPPPFIPLPVSIQMRVLDAIHFDRTGPEAADDPEYVTWCDARVREAMQSALTEMATGFGPSS